VIRTVEPGARAQEGTTPATRRLFALADLSRADRVSLEAAARSPQIARTRREIVREGAEMAEPQIIVSGWAARVRLLMDGRRQFLSFLLPGDLIGYCSPPQPLALATVVALTDVRLCPAPDASASPGLAQAYTTSRALDEAYLLAHVTRLGRLNAQERIGDLMLELHERLTPAGLVSQNGFELPLTQETLGDVLGLTSVHINRMLQLMRREGDLVLKGGRLVLPDPALLARKVGRSRIRVSAGMA